MISKDALTAPNLITSLSFQLLELFNRTETPLLQDNKQRNTGYLKPIIS
jgi:hypothetical protein